MPSSLPCESLFGAFELFRLFDAPFLGFLAEERGFVKLSLSLLALSSSASVSPGTKICFVVCDFVVVCSSAAILEPCFPFRLSLRTGWLLSSSSSEAWPPPPPLSSSDSSLALFINRTVLSFPCDASSLRERSMLASIGVMFPCAKNTCSICSAICACASLCEFFCSRVCR